MRSRGSLSVKLDMVYYHGGIKVRKDLELSKVSPSELHKSRLHMQPARTKKILVITFE